MLRTTVLSLCCGLLLAAEPTASDLAADLITTRAGELAQRGDGAVAKHLERLAAGVRAGRIPISEAQQVLALAQILPPAAPPPPGHRAPAPRPPAMTAEQAGAALDGRPMPPPGVGPMPPPPVPSAAAISPPSPPPPAGPPPRVIGHILAIEPGADGKPALLALATDAEAGVKPGNRIAVRRGDLTMAVARVTTVKPDLTIALLIPGTWHDDQADIRVDDAVVLLAE